MKLSESLKTGLWIGAFLVLSASVLTGCGSSGGNEGSDKPVVTINKLKLSASELKADTVYQAGYGHMAEGSSTAPEWLDHIIERELLVQEAQALGLDREDEFMIVIEHFWKGALIKQLLRRKSKEVTQETHVYEPEIEAYYETLKKAHNGAIAPLAGMRDEIKRIVQENKETAAIDAWVAQLRGKAEIIVDEKELSKLK